MLALGPHCYALRADSTVGGEVYERELLARLPARDVSLALGLPRGHRHEAPPPGWEVTTLRHSTRVRWPLAPLAFAPWIVRRLRGGGVDLLRGHSIRCTGPALLLARRVAGSRVPVVLHQHHLEPRWAGVEVAIMRAADLVVTVSAHSRAALLARGLRPDAVRVVPDGVAGPPPGEPWPEAWPAGGLRLLHVGRLEERKRPGLAIEALAALRGTGVAASLVLAGDGPLRGELARLARRAGVGDVVRLLGRVEDGAKWRLYDTADTLVFCSELEGFGLVAAEAQSRGTPVVAAAGTGVEETLRDGESGFLVAPEPRALASALAALADPARRRRMGEAASAHARGLTWEACADRVAALYAELVSRTGSTRSTSRARTASGR